MMERIAMAKKLAGSAEELDHFKNRLPAELHDQAKVLVEKLHEVAQLLLGDNVNLIYDQEEEQIHG